MKSLATIVFGTLSCLTLFALIYSLFHPAIQVSINAEVIEKQIAHDTNARVGLVLVAMFTFFSALFLVASSKTQTK
jgi:uncharacterized BrkB/YihY/UPF0761 family membrane protein